VIRYGLYATALACVAATSWVYLRARGLCEVDCGRSWGFLIMGFAFALLFFLAGWAHGRR
jgi:hypothetical protein